MLLCARLVVIALLNFFPQYTFEIPPFLSRGIPLSAQQQSTAPPAPVTGDWVARQVDSRDTGRDARSSMQMRLFDRQNRKRERTLTLLALEGINGGGDRLLMRFTYPNDIAGTSFLVWERDGAEDERFLFLPALGRVRRIAGSERQESFVGSDFTYEEIGGRALEDYTYALLDANATFTDAEGRAHPAYQLESRAKQADALYPRVVSLVRKDNFVVVRAEIFNRRNEREKEYRVLRLEQVSGIWTALSVVMTNELDRTRTELTTTSVSYNVGLKESDFSRRELERGAK
jgi:Outer membrane lipoprotein-sorting protein